MRLLIGFILLVAQAALTNAPGDRYFGKFKMSALRIRYETMQLRKRYETHQLLPEQAEHLVILTDDAYLEWSRLYPHDVWLPSTGFLLGQLYAELPGGHAHDRAVALFVYVKSHFPTSPYARLSRDQLYRGVRTKPYPAWANRARAQTPPPSPAPTELVTPVPRARQPATPVPVMPSPSPTAGAAATARAPDVRTKSRSSLRRPPTRRV